MRSVLYVFSILCLQINASQIIDITKTSNEVEIVLNNQVEFNLLWTFCLRFKLDRESMGDYRGFFHDIEEKVHLDLDVGTKMGVLFYGKGSMIFSIPDMVLHPNQWNHFCMSINDTSYLIITNGQVWFEADHTIENSTITIDKLVIGKAARKIASSNDLIGSISGMILLLTVQLLTDLVGLGSFITFEDNKFQQWNSVIVHK